MHCILIIIDILETLTSQKTMIDIQGSKIFFLIQSYLYLLISPEDFND